MNTFPNTYAHQNQRKNQKYYFECILYHSERYTVRLQNTHHIRRATSTGESDDEMEDDELGDHQEHPIGTIGGGTGRGRYYADEYMCMCVHEYL